MTFILSNFVIYAASDEEKVTIYLVKEDAFDCFLESHELSDLINNFSTTAVICNKCKDLNDDIDITYNVNDSVKKSSSEIRLGNNSTIINSKFVDEFGKTENIEKLFADNGIKCNVKEYALILPDSSYLSDVPFTVFAETNLGIFFVTRETKLLYSENSGFDESVMIKIYTQEEYCKKFGLKQGKLCVGGKTISDNAIFRNKFIRIPFRNVMEELGCNVSWNGSRKAAVFSKCGNEFLLRTDNYFAVVKAEDADANKSFPAGGIMPYVRIVQGCLSVDNSVMNSALSAIGATMKIDYDNLIVNIS